MFQRNSGSEKVLKKRGKEYQKFQSKVFCLSVPKYLVGEQPFSAVFQKISGSEKLLEKQGVYQEFPWKVFCLTVPTNLVREQPFCAVFQKMSGSENVLKKRGKEYQKFQSIVFVSQCRKIGWGNNPSVLCFRKFPVAGKV